MRLFGRTKPTATEQIRSAAETIHNITEDLHQQHSETQINLDAFVAFDVPGKLARVPLALDIGIHCQAALFAIRDSTTTDADALREMARQALAENVILLQKEKVPSDA